MNRPNSFMLTVLLAFSVCLTGPAQAKDETAADSLFISKTTWKNQNDQAIKLKDLQQKNLILTMTYTGCQYSCPMTLKKLERIEKDLLKSGVQNYRFVVVSFDPKFDTPAALKAYMSKKQYKEDHWTFLTGRSDEDVRELALLLNINYQREGEKDFSHSNGFALLDPEGRLDVQLNSLNADHAQLVEKMVSYEKRK